MGAARGQTRGGGSGGSSGRKARKEGWRTGEGSVRYDPTGAGNLYKVSVDANGASWADYPTLGRAKRSRGREAPGAGEALEPSCHGWCESSRRLIVCAPK